jgi:hypothetical protein
LKKEAGMAYNDPLPSSGRGWEFEVFGVCSNEDPVCFPEYRGIKESIQEVMWMPLERTNGDGTVEQYDPMNPSWAMSGQLWSAVMKHLPRKVAGGWHSGPLSLHIACRDCTPSLDFYHGIDAFFFWEGVYVALDVSLLPKYEVKADFLITPVEMTGEKLGSLGKEIAALLKRRRRAERHKNMKKKIASIKG